MTKPDWKEVKQYEDITYHKCDGVARIAFDRPEVRNAFRPDTLLEMQEAFRDNGIEFAHRNVTVYMPPDASDTENNKIDKKAVEAGAAAALASAQAEEEQKKPK